MTSAPGRNLGRRYPLELLSRSRDRLVYLGVIAAIGGVAIMGAVSYGALSDLGRSFRGVDETQTIIAGFRGAVANLRQAESAYRGYLITGSETQLNAFRSSSATALQQIELLNDPGETSRVRIMRMQMLDSLVRERIAGMESNVRIFQSAGFDAAQQQIQLGKGLALSEQIGTLIDQIRTDEERERVDRLARARSDDVRARVVVVSSSLVAILLLVAAARVIAWDIAQRKDTESELRAAVRAADAANDAKTQFLASVSHEIRTPLNAIMGMTELLLDTRLASEQIEFARTIHTNSEALSTLISDLLDSSKIEAGQVDLESIPFDPGELIDGVAEILAIRAELKGLDLVVALDSGLASQVLGDPNRFRQVLMNLVGNAIKFTEYGEIVIRAGLTPRTTSDGSDRLVVSVRDTGIGIDREHRDRIFERFVQADRSTVRRFGGTGLGLSISRSLVELMGGTLTLESTVGKGSEFRFHLPVEVLAPPRLDFPENQNALGGKRALVADSNSTRAEVIAAFLRKLGAIVDLKDDAAIFDARVRDGGYDLAVIDEGIADFPGIVMSDSVRSKSNGQDTRVILISSLHSPLAPRLTGSAIAGRVYKPVRQTRLFRSVREAVALDVPSEVAAKIDQSRVAPRGVLPRRILLAEDQRDNWILVTRLLTGAGYEVDLAENGLVAVERATEYQYDLILMDIEMPVMDGFQATAAIRAAERNEHLNRVPILALTAHAVEEFRDKGLASGMDDYLTKPVKKRQLLDVCAKWIDKRPVILVADDSLENHMLLANYLKDKQYRVVFAKTGLEAVNIFRRRRVSIVLMDMDMPVMDGYEATRTIRRLPKGTHVPIVAITGYEGAAERERCMNAGCSAFLSKPMRRAELLQVIESVLENGGPTPVFEQHVETSQGDGDGGLQENVLGTIRQKRSEIASLRRHAAQRDYQFIVNEMRVAERLGETLELRDVAVVSAELREAARRNDDQAIELWLDRLNDALKNAERLTVVRQSGLLDSPPEEEFDRLTRLASSVLRVPIALITIVDQDRQFLKSCVGLDEPYATSRETPISHSFCQHVVTQGEPLVVEDARNHPLVMDNPAIADMSVIAYAGMPLMTDDGIALGSFCAIDTKPRQWSKSELAMLRDFADLVIREWEQKRAEKAIVRTVAVTPPE